MVGTASAVFAASTVSYEIRGAGFARQQLQTRNAARAGLVGALEWFDIFGPEKAIRKRIMSVVTDSTPVDDPKDPDKCNVMALLRCLAGEDEVVDLDAEPPAGKPNGKPE